MPFYTILLYKQRNITKLSLKVSLTSHRDFPSLQLVNLSATMADIPEESNAIQRDPDRLERWVHGNLVKFNRPSAMPYTWVRATPSTNTHRAWEQIDSSSREKDLGCFG